MIRVVGTITSFNIEPEMHDHYSYSGRAMRSAGRRRITVTIDVDDMRSDGGGVIGEQVVLCPVYAEQQPIVRQPAPPEPVATVIVAPPPPPPAPTPEPKKEDPKADPLDGTTRFSLLEVD